MTFCSTKKDAQLQYLKQERQKEVKSEHKSGFRKLREAQAKLDETVFLIDAEQCVESCSPKDSNQKFLEEGAKNTQRQCDARPHLAAH